VWATWQTCCWEPDTNPQMWECTLPIGHSGPHIAYLHMENDPKNESYVGSSDGTNWMPPPLCGFCGETHPGFRHATHNDPVCIAEDDELWGPEKNSHFPSGPQLAAYFYVPTFVDTFPTPPKFTSVEEAEAWLEANPP